MAFVTAGVKNKPDETNNTQVGCKLNLRRGKPVFLGAAVQYELQAGNTQRHQRQAHPVHIAFATFGIRDIAQDQKRGEDTHGQIDKEGPTPGHEFR